MARIILFSNRKGCTGKSTLCIQLQVEFSTLKEIEHMPFITLADRLQ